MGVPDQASSESGATFDGVVDSNGHRLHKPGVAGSSPAAASLFSDEPIGAYHADRNWFSKSQLWDLVSRGPQVFYAKHIAGTDNSRLDHPSLSRGTHVHEWAEGGDAAFWARVVQIPESALGSGGRRTKATDEFESDILAKRPDAVFLKAEEIGSYRAQFRAMQANPVFGELSAATTHRELSIRWRDSLGLPLKCRPDAMTDDCVWDIKTTKEQSPLETFWRSVVDYGYAFQVEHYLAGLRAAGMGKTKFIFLISSTVPPYACHAVTLPERLLARARKQVRKTLAEIQSRLDLDHWLPADSGQITELFVPERYMEERNGHRPSNAWVQ